MGRITIFDTTAVDGGTGAYAGATGSGVATANPTIVSGRNPNDTFPARERTPIFELSSGHGDGTSSLA